MQIECGRSQQQKLEIEKPVAIAQLENAEWVVSSEKSLRQKLLTMEARERESV